MARPTTPPRPGMVLIEREGFRCQRCSHEWCPRHPEPPAVCPLCKSPYWNRPRKDDARRHNGSHVPFGRPPLHDSGRMVSMSLAVPAALKARIAAEAARRGTSVNALMREWIETTLCVWEDDA